MRMEPQRTVLGPHKSVLVLIHYNTGISDYEQFVSKCRTVEFSCHSQL